MKDTQIDADPTDAELLKAKDCEIAKLQKQVDFLYGAACNGELIYAEYMALKPDATSQSFGFVTETVRATRRLLAEARALAVT